MTTHSLLINGQHLPSSSGEMMDVINPATEEVIALVPSATDADVDAAVASARAALEGPWARLSARERGRILWKLGDLLLERVDDIARMETLHNGKPIFESRHIEVPAAAECFQYYAGWADKVHGETIPVKGNYLAYTLREPVGVVAAIVPWNFPLLLTAWKVAPALACGNTVVLKPASQTPLTALALGDRARDHAGRRRDAETAHARTGGQVAEYRVPRCGHRGRGTGSVDGDLLRQGGGLCGGLAPAGGS